MPRLLAFDQIELLSDTLEDMQIEFGVYKQHAESVIPSEELIAEVQAAKADPSKRAEARQRYSSLREQLRQMAVQLSTEDAEQAPPPSGQTN